MQGLDTANNQAPALTVVFCCKYADDFEVSIPLIGDDRVQALNMGWRKGIEHYCPRNIEGMLKQLKRKLGGIYNFHDLSDIVLRFKDLDGKWDEIVVSTDYAFI
ncbi:MAG: hypothetical protein ACRC4N_03880 [Gammaproteobacteria bacterium]